MDPEQKLNRLGQSQRNFRYPTEVAQEGVSHFMLIKELKFNKPKRNDDPIINREVKDGLTNFNEFIFPQEQSKQVIKQSMMKWI